MAIYMIKINLALVVLYGFYKMIFTGDTFFTWRRATLIGIYLLAAVVPSLNFTYWANANTEMVAIANDYADVVLPTVTITAEGGTAALWIPICEAIYGIVTLLLLLRFVWQIVSIVRLKKRCNIVEMNGIEVYKLTGKEGPFSFFNWIFINPAHHNAKETEAILTHELTHCKERHSADILFTELFGVLFWFNPFVWLLKREVRLNLEYLADHKVLSMGADSKAYQYHLLGLTYSKNVATISNNFNVLPLKKRIKMMNKKRTNGIAKAKYALIVPMAATLLVVSNIETVAREMRTTVTNIAQMSAKTEADAQGKPQHRHKKVVRATQTRKPVVKQEAVVKKEKAAETVVSKAVEEPVKKVYKVAEEMPQFDGNITEWLFQNVKYPAEAMKNKEEGRVIVKFVVGADGQVRDAELVRSVSPALDQEAIRVVNAMPKWKPGKVDGKNISVWYTLPVTFKSK